MFQAGRMQKLMIIGGIYGLSSKDFIPADVVAVYDNMVSKTPIDRF